MTDENERSDPDPPKQAPRDNWWVRFVSYVKRKRYERAAKKKSETPADKAARRTAVATVWMAIFTFVLAGTSALTIWILKNQLREMHEGGIDTHALAVASDKTEKSAEKSAQAARDFADTADDINGGVATAAKQLQASADNAKKWTTIAQNSLRLDARAWISTTIIGSTIKPSVPIAATLRIQNVGRTPATKIAALIKMESVPGDNPPTFTYERKILDDQPVSGHFELGTLLPGGQLDSEVPLVIGAKKGTMIGRVALDPDKVGNLSSGAVKLYLHGEITYCDAFRMKHWIKFCYVYQPDSTQLSAGGNTGGFVGCEKHNETDDQIEKPEPCPASKPN